jgi:hypothetical protein
LIKKIIKLVTLLTVLCFAALVCLLVYFFGKSYLESRIPKPCVNSYLPNLQLCTPRDYSLGWLSTVKTPEEYNWKNSPLIDAPESGNKLVLVIPRTVLPVLPLDYDDGDGKGGVIVTLGPTGLSAEQRQTQFEHYKNNTVLKSDGNGMFIYCNHYDDWGGDPEERKYCYVKMDLDEKITNPRIELSFSIAPQDFEHWYENAEKVRAFLRIYTITSPTTLTNLKGK